MGGGLEAYRAKRDPRRTPEPFGDGTTPARRPSPNKLFVIQKHSARQLHYDFRLELGGTLKSWAVPRGPSIRHGERRLAVHVEDHPIEYADFEGVIPRGNYGAGEVIVWDRGWYRSAKPEPLEEQLARGRLEIELFGVKLRGRWNLVRSAKARDWLLLKADDAHAGGDEPTERLPESILSGLTVEELRRGAARVAELRAFLRQRRVPAGAVSAATQPVMLATLGDRPFARAGWLFEVKYDGIRILAERDGRRVELYGRAGQRFTDRYPELVAALRTLPVERFVLDGEVVALDERGRPSFQRLQARMHLTRASDIAAARGTTPVTGVFFDALAADGRDLRALPLEQRKRCLALLVPSRGVIHYGDHVLEQGEAFYEAASEQRIEGIVAKRLSSRYEGGRSRDWIKIKCQLRQEFVIGGYTTPQGTRARFGALHLGVYEGDTLVYVGRVGTGFDDARLDEIWERLQPLRRPASPFGRGRPAGRGHTFVEPALVCEVRFTEWTHEGGIRHPAFLGLRADKPPTACRREIAAGTETMAGSTEVERTPPPATRRTPHRAARPAAAERQVQLSNVTKVFWPDGGFTKGDLIAYYDLVAPRLLPYLRDRPLVLTRYPDGIAGKSFYQKDAPHFAPEWLRTVRIHAADAERDIDYVVVDDALALRYIINLGAIPLHLWGSRIGSLERPDWLILDLDPKGAPFTDVVRVAQEMKRILDGLRLAAFLKTSGATGLHILLPLGARYSWEETRTFARLLATLGVEALPRVATITRQIRARDGKVYIDWLQNVQGQTIAAPFSVRPMPGATVSCPLRWDELTATLDPKQFTIVTVPARFRTMADPFAGVLTGGVDIAAALARLERRVAKRAAR